jgi:hypothetical protein
MIIDRTDGWNDSHAEEADFRDVLGQWTPDPEFGEILKTQRQIDPDKWK